LSQPVISVMQSSRVVWFFCEICQALIGHDHRHKLILSLITRTFQLLAYFFSKSLFVVCGFSRLNCFSWSLSTIPRHHHPHEGNIAIPCRHCRPEWLWLKFNCRASYSRLCLPGPSPFNCHHHWLVSRFYLWPPRYIYTQTTLIYFDGNYLHFIFSPTSADHSMDVSKYGHVLVFLPLFFRFLGGNFSLRDWSFFPFHHLPLLFPSSSYHLHFFTFPFLLIFSLSEHWRDSCYVLQAWSDTQGFKLQSLSLTLLPKVDQNGSLLIHTTPSYHFFLSFFFALQCIDIFHVFL